MKKKNSTKKKTTKKSSKYKNKKKNKKKKLLKSTENAIKKKMAPTKKTKYVEDSEGNQKNVPDDLDGTLTDISVGDGVKSASDLVDGLSNGSELSDDDLDSLATGKKAK